MKYKGFIISPNYTGTVKIVEDGMVLDLDKNGTWKPVRKVGKQDIDFYDILDPMENDRRWISEATIAECKATIDAFLLKVGMKDNTPARWAKLDK